MSGWGEDPDWVTLQSSADNLAIFYCSACGRFGRAAPRYQECSGSERSPHAPVEAQIVGEEYAGMLTPADDAPILS